VTCKRCGTVFCDDTVNDSYWLSDARALYCSRTCRKRAAPSAREHRKRKRAEKREQSREAARKARCPTPAKRPFQDPVQAVAALRESPHYGKPGRPYHCACGQWHITSKPLRSSDAIRLAATDEGTAALLLLPGR
jgi:hypothetical protein